jgi:hypothetical protein
VFKRYRHNALKMGRAFDLSLDQFKLLIGSPCLFCGERTEPRGVDRWDNNVGYTLANSRPCCWPCNKLKGSVSGESFIATCQKVSKYQEEKYVT